MLLAAGNLSAQDKIKEADKTKEVQAGKKVTEKQAAEASKNKATVSEEKKNCVLVDIEMTDICGNKVDLKKYKGKVVMIVNVASKCGFTGQYKPLQALHKQYNEHGFEVIAFPCNQFGKQEPADEPSIDSFCKKKFGIEFDLFAKVDVKGAKQAELFKRLTKCNLAPAGKGAIHWNFEKFLIDKDGKPIARFRSNVSPDDDKIVSKLKAALGIQDDEKEKVAPAKKEAKAVDQDADKKTAPKVKQDKKS